MGDLTDALVGMIVLLVVIIGVGVLCWLGIWATTVLLQNPVMEQTCHNVTLSGFKTEIRHIYLVGIDNYDCYVNADGNMVPYDAWRVFSNN